MGCGTWCGASDRWPGQGACVVHTKYRAVAVPKLVLSLGFFFYIY